MIVDGEFALANGRVFKAKEKMADEKDKKTIEQPGVEIQELLDSVLEAGRTDVVFLGRKVSLGWMYYEQERKFTHISLTEDDAKKRDAKLCAVLLLDGRWKLKLRYWWLWRRLYYWETLNAVEVLRLLDAAKKKIPSAACSLITILATGMSDVLMTMRKAEADASRAARAGVQGTR